MAKNIDQQRSIVRTVNILKGLCDKMMQFFWAAIEKKCLMGKIICSIKVLLF